MNIRIFFRVLFVLFFGSAFAQQTTQVLWSKTIESEIKVTGQRQIIPAKYLTYRLALPELKELLLLAPHEKSVKLNESSSIVILPLPNGELQRFRVVESPVMAPELAASFPDIKTFSVKGIDDPYANGKLDINEFGFHAMILSVNGDFFIDPYATLNTADYTVYYSKDFIKDPAHRMPAESVVVEKEKNSAGSKKKRWWRKSRR